MIRAAVIVVFLTALTACSPARVPIAAPSPSPSIPASPLSPEPEPSPTPLVPTSLAGTSAKAVITPSGVVAPVLRAQADGALVGTPCGNSAIVSTGIPLDGATVVLDPGHGGSEVGAVGPNGLTEKELNLVVTGFAESFLRGNGANVVLTRTTDYRVTLEARGKIVKALEPKAFVSIHHNAEADGPRSGPGSETFYQTVGPSSAESKRLAGLVYEEVVSALSQFQGISWVGDTDAGAKYRKSSSGNDYYGIIRHTQGTPGVLAELAFLSNPPEADLLTRVDVQQAEGEAVARGISRFLTTNDPGSGFTEPYPRQAPAGGGGGAAGCTDPPL